MCIRLTELPFFPEVVNAGWENEKRCDILLEFLGVNKPADGLGRQRFVLFELQYLTEHLSTLKINQSCP